MKRQNLFSGGWDGENLDETGLRWRTFWRPDDARMGATLWELVPGARGGDPGIIARFEIPVE